MTDVITESLTHVRNELQNDIEKTFKILAEKEQMVKKGADDLLESIVNKQCEIKRLFTDIENEIAEFGQKTLDTAYGLSNANGIITDKDAG